MSHYDVCPICLDDYETNRVRINLDCGHALHYSCWKNLVQHAYNGNPHYVHVPVAGRRGIFLNENATFMCPMCRSVRTIFIQSAHRGNIIMFKYCQKVAARVWFWDEETQKCSRTCHHVTDVLDVMFYSCHCQLTRNAGPHSLVAKSRMEMLKAAKRGNEPTDWHAVQCVGQSERCIAACLHPADNCAACIFPDKYSHVTVQAMLRKFR